jgi:RNA polymerase sigma-70 factor (ECF subfamily)
MEELPESVLVRLAQNGSQAAFQELTGRAREGCIRMAMTMLRNHDDAEDEVQNAFLKAYTRLTYFKHESAFSTWLIRIVINHCLMRYRRCRRLQFVSYESKGADGDWYAAHQPVQSETPEHDVGRQEVIKLLRTELHRIPCFLRAPLEMRYLEDRSLEEMARTLGVSIAAAKSRLHRAHGYLRERMVRHCGSRGAGTLMRAC